LDLEYEQSEIHDIARRFIERFGQYSLFAFHGGMGAGKTTFIHALCDELGVTTPVNSPTFSIINEYGGKRPVYHLDLYRLSDANEAMNAGVEDCLYSGAICFVEWPERAASLLPPDTVHVYLEATGGDKRRIRVEDK
jgi:tRNA threonylcarbamoyladenosine biosynthesis protein TsaE